MKKFYQSIRKMGKVAVGIVAFAMIFGLAFNTVTVSAAIQNEKEEVECAEKNTRAAHLLFSSTYDGSSNYYTGLVFDSLPEAKARFGYDYTYKSCYKVYDGVVFNHYYSFSDGTRCYFIVD